MKFSLEISPTHLRIDEIQLINSKCWLYRKCLLDYLYAGNCSSTGRIITPTNQKLTLMMNNLLYKSVSFCRLAFYPSPRCSPWLHIPIHKEKLDFQILMNQLCTQLRVSISRIDRQWEKYRSREFSISFWERGCAINSM